jgi:phosphate starvation-inducible PhoH-like protein
MVGLLGERDEYLRVIEGAYDVDVVARGNEIALSGPQASEAELVINELVLLLEGGQHIDTPVVRRAIDMVGDNVRPSEVLTDRVITTARGKPVRPKTAGQKTYLDAIQHNMVTFGIGPAGTGKSWLAVACAVRSLQNKEVDRIILTRPAVEAGERLGFLPGDLMSKVDPYLRPLYDALHDMVGAEGMAKLFERNAVEVAPLAFMRGRTLNDSFIILDEAQNTTPEQMKMFLTRIGFNSRVVVTGDETQVDVAGGRSGLGGTEAILTGVDNVAFVRLKSKDVVRHRIVQDIVDAYERNLPTS